MCICLACHFPCTLSGHVLAIKRKAMLYMLVGVVGADAIEGYT